VPADPPTRHGATEYKVNGVQLRVQTTRTAGVATVHLAGEVDLATIDLLRTVLQATTHAVQPRRINVDLAQVTFMDAAGLGVLVRAQRHTRQLGADLVVCNAHGIVRRVVDLTGLAGRFGLTWVRGPVRVASVRSGCAACRRRQRLVVGAPHADRRRTTSRCGRR
jgi:anti-anti-sigma factor